MWSEFLACVPNDVDKEGMASGSSRSLVLRLHVHIRHGRFEGPICPVSHGIRLSLETIN